MSRGAMSRGAMSQGAMSQGAALRVAVLGAGPVGLDAAAAFLEAEHAVRVYEAERAAAGVRAWGHVRLFTPWSMNTSPRMRARIPGIPTSSEVCPTGHEFAEAVLDPLAAWLGPAVVRTGTRVLGITRAGLLKHEAIGDPARARSPLRLLLADPHGRQWSEYADVVVDATGSYGRGNPLGDGGLRAPGEAECAAAVVRTLPDLDDLERARQEFAGTTLLVGAGKSAQTAARDLAALVERTPGARVVWAVRDPHPDWGAVPDDPLPERQALVARSAALHAGAVEGVEVRVGVSVERLHAQPDPGVAVELRGTDGTLETLRADRVLALTGYLGDTGLYRQLQVHECYATAAPMNLAAALLAATGEGPVDCLTLPTPGIDELRSPEPDFFVLGVKSYGHNPAFLLRNGYAQVDHVTAAYPHERIAS